MIVFSPQQKISLQYPFLDLLTESKASMKGANLADKNAYALYHAVQKNSTIYHASQNALFNISMPVDGLLDTAKERIVSMLKKLSDDQLIAQIFHLEYRGNKLRLIPCYLALTSADQPLSIYQAAMRVCVANVDAMLQSASNFDTDILRETLIADALAVEVDPQNYKQILFDPFENIQAENFDFPPAPQLIATSIAEIQNGMVQNDKIINIPHYGHISIRKGEILDKLEVAETVLKTKIVDHYQKKSLTLQSILNEIFLEESVYEMDPFAPETSEFSVRLAKALKDHINSRKNFQDGKYPGALAIEIIIGLGPKVKGVYEDKRREENIQEYTQIRDQLLRSKVRWSDMVFFMREEQKELLHPETWTYLEEDRKLAYAKWELPGETIWIFTQRNIDSIVEIVEQMSRKEDVESWQALALRHLLELYENELYGLFDRPELLSSYGKLLRKVYMYYMPWYFRILLLMRIEWWLDRSYQTAKIKITREQQAHALQNEKRRHNQKIQQNKARSTSLRQLRSLSLLNRMLTKLDFFYFQKKWIPTIDDVITSMEGHEAQNLVDCIKKEKFFTIAPLKSDANWQHSILLYPKNKNWPIYAARLKKLLETDMSDSEQLDSEQAMRHKRLSRFLRYEGAAPPAEINTKAANQEEGDPYLRFEAALAEHQKQEAAKDRAQKTESKAAAKQDAGSAENSPLPPAQT